MDKIIGMPSQIAERLLHTLHNASHITQSLTQSICLQCLDILLTPYMESDTTQTDNPFQSLSVDVPPPQCHKTQMSVF